MYRKKMNRNSLGFAALNCMLGCCPASGIHPPCEQALSIDPSHTCQIAEVEGAMPVLARPDLLPPRSLLVLGGLRSVLLRVLVLLLDPHLHISHLHPRADAEVRGLRGCHWHWHVLLLELVLVLLVLLLVLLLLRRRPQCHGGGTGEVEGRDGRVEGRVRL